MSSEAKYFPCAQDNLIKIHHKDLTIVAWELGQVIPGFAEMRELSKRQWWNRRCLSTVRVLVEQF